MDPFRTVRRYVRRWTISEQIDRMERHIMATFEEVQATLVQVRDAAINTNTRLDGVNVKIDELRALVNAGGVITGPQLDELAALASEARVNLADVDADLVDAEQS